MDSDSRSPSPDNTDTKTTFRKPSSDAANRKYRRRSPASGSSSSDAVLRGGGIYDFEIPKWDRNSSPNNLRDDPVKATEHRSRWKDGGREEERDSNGSRYSRSGDSFRHTDRQSSRGSHGYSRRDDYIQERQVDEEERNYKRLSSRSGRESRGGTHTEFIRKESEHSKSRDYSRDVDKYSRDKYDGHRSKDKDREASSLEHQKYKERESFDRAGSGKRHASIEEVERGRYTRDRDRDDRRDYYRSSGDYRGDRLSYEETRGHRNNSTSGGDVGKRNLKDAYKRDSMELDGGRLSKEEKKKYNDRETDRDKDRYIRQPGEHADKLASLSENQESPTKKPKQCGLDKDTHSGKDVKPVSKFSSVAEDPKVTPGHGQANETDSANDLNAAKVAAMKAAELVNRNLVGVGSCMTTDQKKKLLWGNKKSTTVEESGSRWDTAQFSDRERQEKFNKLMGVKGDLKLEHKPDNPEGGDVQAEKQKELQMDLEKQYTAGLRRRDGRTVGLGL